MNNTTTFITNDSTAFREGREVVNLRVRCERSKAELFFPGRWLVKWVHFQRKFRNYRVDLEPIKQLTPIHALMMAVCVILLPSCAGPTIEDAARGCGALIMSPIYLMKSLSTVLQSHENQTPQAQAGDELLQVPGLRTDHHPGGNQGLEEKLLRKPRPSCPAATPHSTPD